MKRNRKGIIFGIIVTLVVIVGFAAFNNDSLNKQVNSTTQPIIIHGPNTDGFTLLYQIDNIHGSNCFHFPVPKTKISSLFFVVFLNNSSQGNCILVYNSTHCYFAHFPLKQDENLISVQQVNISDIYAGNWSISVNFILSSQVGNYHFLVYYKTGDAS